MKKTAWEIFKEISPLYYNYENSNRQNAFFYTKDIENMAIEFANEKTYLFYEGDDIKWEDEFDFDNCHVDEESKSIIFTDKCNNILTVGVNRE